MSKFFERFLRSKIEFLIRIAVGHTRIPRIQTEEYCRYLYLEIIASMCLI
jgi:hypothetical protein